MWDLLILCRRQGVLLRSIELFLSVQIQLSVSAELMCNYTGSQSTSEVLVCTVS